MPTVALYNIAGEKIGDIDLNNDFFGAEINEAAMYELVKNYLANQRHGTQSTLTRTEVRGGGRKPWRQKGTGRARQGSIRSPQWKGGGVALGPKPRSYRYCINKKLRRVALKSALSSKVLSEDIIVLDNLEFSEVKTKQIASMLKNLNVSSKALIVTGGKDSNVVLSARNISDVKTTMASTLNVYDILKHEKFIITKCALAKIEEVYAQ